MLRSQQLSATMLGDNPEKSKNPLKKAMRRRNAKTVQFCAPTYVEASDVEYSSDEEDGEGDPYGSEGESPEAQVQAQAQNGQQDEEGILADPLKGKDSNVDGIQSLEMPDENADRDLNTTTGLSRSSDEMFDRHGEWTQSSNLEK